MFVPPVCYSISSSVLLNAEGDSGFQIDPEVRLLHKSRTESHSLTDADGGANDKTFVGALLKVEHA